MNISVNTQAILLLTSWFTRGSKADYKPLTPSEWGRFANWLKERDKTPSGLLECQSPADYLNGWTDSKITNERIAFLLGRSVALSLSLEKWQRAGLWVMTRSDVDYPSRLKKHLKADAPPVLFGCGNRQLLDKGGIAMVGSRDATQEQLAVTAKIAGDTATQGYSIVSGGARGVDEAAMLGALENEGTVIGILADNLLRTATSAKYRKGLMAKNLVLVSPFNPEAGFEVGNAMARNKYIYCLSDAAIVVATTKGSGGTWNGAVENLKKGWVPLWVLDNSDANSGNAALVKQGSKWLPNADYNAGLLINKDIKPTTAVPVEVGLFDLELPAAGATFIAESALYENTIAETCQSKLTTIDIIQSDRMTFYDFFLRRFEAVTNGSPVTIEKLLTALDINKSQLNDWVKQGISEGRIQKLNKPVRYLPVKEVQHRQETLDL